MVRYQRRCQSVEKLVFIDDQFPDIFFNRAIITDVKQHLSSRINADNFEIFPDHHNGRMQVIDDCLGRFVFSSDHIETYAKTEPIVAILVNINLLIYYQQLSCGRRTKIKVD